MLIFVVLSSQYKISLDTLRSATLNLSVWHNDNFGRNSFLGEVDVDLRMWNISDTQMKDYLLRPRVSMHVVAEMHNGLCNKIRNSKCMVL